MLSQRKDELRQKRGALEAGSYGEALDGIPETTKSHANFRSRLHDDIKK